MKFCKRVMQRVIVMDPPVTPVKMKKRPTICRGLSLIAVWQRHLIQHRSSCGVLGDESDMLTDFDLFCVILYSVPLQVLRCGYLVPVLLDPELSTHEIVGKTRKQNVFCLTQTVGHVFSCVATGFGRASCASRCFGGILIFFFWYLEV